MGHPPHQYQQLLRLVANGFYTEAFTLFNLSRSASSPPPLHHFTFPPLLKACGKLKEPCHGTALHSHIIKTGFLIHTYTGTALADMYMKLLRFDDALKVFVEIPERNLASLNALISGCWRNGFPEEALRVFKDMSFQGFRPNSVTLATVLPACGNVEHVMQVHCWAVKSGVVLDVYVATSLLTLYSSFGEMVLAANVFGEMPVRNIVSYNAYYTALLQNDDPSMVLVAFKKMRSLSSEDPNSITLVSVLTACSSLSHLQFGRQIHAVIRKSALHFDAMVGTALVDMYSKCGSWFWAYDIFVELNDRSLITWNAMIAGLMLCDQSDIAVELFQQLEREGLEPDSATWNSMISGFSQLGKGPDAFKYFVKMQSANVGLSLKCMTSLLRACSVLSALKPGKEIHGHAIRANFCSEDFMATALIDMYMKCGYSSFARRLFDQFPQKPHDPAFWNAMISGYGRNGQNELAMEIFNLMQQEGVKPSSATFTCALHVCSHTGQVDRGLKLFKAMTEVHNMAPKAEHISCMVDLLGRADKLEEVQDIKEEMRNPTSSMFASVLAACRSRLNAELGEEIVTKILKLEPENATPLVILSNIYAELGRWSEVERIREVINDRGLTKVPASSSVGVAMESTWQT